jgi:SAM-dependent methyltransferase
LKARFGIEDFLKDEPPVRFDWVFEHTLFCAIDPRDRDDYVKAVARWLKPDGHYLAVNYLIPDEDGPPFGTARDELVRRFEPHFDLVSDWVPRSYPNRTGLERMLWWKRTKEGGSRLQAR